MAIARVTVLDFADEESKKHNLNLYESRWKEVFPNMHMNNMEARTKLHEDFINIKDDFFYKGDIQMFFQSDKFQTLKLKNLE